MRTTEHYLKEYSFNPLDVIEEFIISQEWSFERNGEEEVIADISCRWGNLGLFFAWMPETSILHVSCAMGLKLKDSFDLPKAYELLALTNEKLWYGHFSLWTNENIPIFRHAMMIDGESETMWDKISDVVEIAINECERFYPAFEYVLKEGQEPRMALRASLLDTIGEA